MLQQSKLLQSRNEWRNKAVQRANEIRERRKLEKRNKETIANLKNSISELKKTIEDQKKTPEFKRNTYC